MSQPKRDIRRNRDSVEFLREIRGLKSLGYSVHQIAGKAKCCNAYVESIFFLLKHGDPKLIAEIEHGHIPHTIGIQISRAKDPELQMILANGFKVGIVGTSQIVTIRKRIDEHVRETKQRDRRSDADSIIRMFANETAARRQLIRRAKAAVSRLEFVAGAFKKLLSEEHFVALIRAQGIHTMPSRITERIRGSAERCSIKSIRSSSTELLTDKPVTTLARNVLRRMKPARQVEAAEFMASTRNFSRVFALALLLASKPEERLARRAKPILGLSQERIAKMQQELECMLKDSSAMQSYGSDMLSLVAASGYVSRLIDERAIESYLHQRHPDLLQKFRAIVSAARLDES
jgi:hypothetical protein